MSVDPAPQNPIPSSLGHRARFIRFLAVGALNTAFGYTVFAATWIFSSSYVAAVVIANGVGATFNYFTVGRWVFANRGLRAFMPFIGGYFIAMILNLCIVHLLTKLSVHPLLAQLIATPLLIIFSFFYNSRVTFRTIQ